MMIHAICRFNQDPIALRQSMALVADDEPIANSVIQSHGRHSDDNDNNNNNDDDDDDDDDDMLVVDQHLDLEQQLYEFPPKSRLLALAYLDDGNRDTFFDKSSFTCSSTTACSVTGFRLLDPDKTYLSHPSTLSLDGPSTKCTRSIASPHSPFSHDTPTHQMTRFLGDKRDTTFSDYDSDKGDVVNELEAMLDLVDDSRLSPLQLPARANSRMHVRPPVDTLTSPVLQRHVGPSAFLAPHKNSPHQQTPHSPDDREGRWPDDDAWSAGNFLSTGENFNLDPKLNAFDLNDPTNISPLDYYDNRQSPAFTDSQSLYIVRHASESLMEDDGDDHSDDSHFDNSTVIIKLNPKTSPLYCKTQCPTRLVSLASDEGYDEDEDENEFPLESESCFLDLSLKDQENMDQQDHLYIRAAVTIQAAWRGYKTRKQLRASSVLTPAQQTLAGLAQLFVLSHQQQMVSLKERICDLELRLREETAMRTAFEKAIEDMTLLMDDQQKLMHDRIEQEVSMRQSYERQMHDALEHVEVLEARVADQAAAHHELEDMMERVLDQVHQMQADQQRQMRQDAAHRETLERQLDEALATVASLKRTSSPHAAKTSSIHPPSITSRPSSRATPRASAPPAPHKTTLPKPPASSPSPHPPRPSVLPSRAQSRATSRPLAASSKPVSRTNAPTPTSAATHKSLARKR